MSSILIYIIRPTTVPLAFSYDFLDHSQELEAQVQKLQTFSIDLLHQVTTYKLQMYFCLTDEPIKKTLKI